MKSIYRNYELRWYGQEYEITEQEYAFLDEFVLRLKTFRDCTVIVEPIRQRKDKHFVFFVNFGDFEGGTVYHVNSCSFTFLQSDKFRNIFNPITAIQYMIQNKWVKNT